VPSIPKPAPTTTDPASSPAGEASPHQR
jgi:hypothetical protein